MMEKIFIEILSFDVEMIVGDFNAQICREGYRKTINNVNNGTGKKFIEFATEKDFNIVSIYFQHKEINKGLWISTR